MSFYVPESSSLAALSSCCSSTWKNKNVQNILSFMGKLRKTAIKKDPPFSWTWRGMIWSWKPCPAQWEELWSPWGIAILHQGASPWTWWIINWLNSGEPLDFRLQWFFQEEMMTSSAFISAGSSRLTKSSGTFCFKTSKDAKKMQLIFCTASWDERFTADNVDNYHLWLSLTIYCKNICVGLRHP